MSHIVKAGEFKAKCLKIMDQVAETGEVVVITKRGRPVAQLGPVVEKPSTLRGFMKGRIKVTGDIISPVIDEGWEEEILKDWDEQNRTEPPER